MSTSPEQPYDQLEDVFERASKHALHYEHQMKSLETKLAENLSNFRAIESLLHDAFVSLQRTSIRSDRALTTHVPTIKSALEMSLEALNDLADTLPTIQHQVRDIRNVYDSGRDRAHSLVHSLTYLNTPLPFRLIQIIFTSSSPVSTQTKVLLRLWFAVMFVLCAALILTGARGALRVYRVRLVWGERLMS